MRLDYWVLVQGMISMQHQPEVTVIEVKGGRVKQHPNRGEVERDHLRSLRKLRIHWIYVKRCTILGVFIIGYTKCSR